MDSPSEPTQVISMLGAYHSQLRHSTSGSGLKSLGNTGGQSIKRSLATRLAFDETMELESEQQRKVSRLDMSSSHHSRLGMRRFNSENIDTVANLQRENHELRERLRDIEVSFAGNKANMTSMENRLKTLETEREASKILWDREKEALEQDKIEQRDKIEGLKFKLKQIKQRQSDCFEEEIQRRKSSLDKTAELELKVTQLRGQKEKLEEQLMEKNMNLANKPDLDKVTFNNQVQEFKSKISELESSEAFLKSEVSRLEKRRAEGEQSVAEAETLRNMMRMEKLRGDKLQAELDANREAVIQRSVMREKLEKYDELDKDNIRLRSTNKLLTENAANAALLKEKLHHLESDRKRLEARCLQMDELRAELELAKCKVRDWGLLVRDWVSADDRDSLGLAPGAEVTIAVARSVVSRWQERELNYVDQLTNLKHNDSSLQDKVTSETAAKKKLELELSGLKQSQEEQARLVKKLQRKLLLVTKERDSYKGILESYEKEMTVTEDNLYQDKINALERNITEYKAIVDMLEEEKRVGSPSVSDNASKTELLEWKNKAEQLQAQNEKLEMELERRAIKGDYNPADTKVIHFLNNPTSTAVDKRAAEMSDLVQENAALKARCQLLEEGQTKDLTLMVGAKVEEQDGEKVKELKVELEKAEKREKRFMEAFSKTSQDFRETVYKLTGYRIDVKTDNLYLLKPMYTDNAEDHLLFRKEKNGEVEMLGSDLSLEYTQLIRETCDHKNSIPLFLAELIRNLYYSKYGVSQEEVEDYNDGDDDDEEEEDEVEHIPDDDSDSRESSPGGSNDDQDDIIEIDDD